mmetsp:Transcript_8079/g.14607  ORF Transcript_8079/g.14607 Transcript_8079/m.14607 type:complete len:126 (-) Transcript_8079:84-461(-)
MAIGVFVVASCIASYCMGLHLLSILSLFASVSLSNGNEDDLAQLTSRSWSSSVFAKIFVGFKEDDDCDENELLTENGFNIRSMRSRSSLGGMSVEKASFGDVNDDDSVGLVAASGNGDGRGRDGM